MEKVWKLDSIHSYVGFRIKMLGIAAIRGHFNQYSGTLTQTKVDWEDAKFEMEGDIASIDTGLKLRDEHLQEAYFFDGIAHPSFKFISTEFIKINDSHFKIKGDITLKGVTKQITLNAEFGGYGLDREGVIKAGFSATSKIAREDFGVAPHALLPNGGVFLNNDVELQIDVQFEELT